MALVPLDRIEPGMILAKDAVDARDRLLLGMGGEITDRHLRLFKIWGVTEVEVMAPVSPPNQGGPEAPLAAPDSAPDPAAGMTPEQSAQLDQLFAHNDVTHPLMAKLRELAVCRLTAPPDAGAES